MKAETAPSGEESNSDRPLTRLEKLRREFRRLTFQANSLIMRPTAMMARNRFLFILGHMRSGSSLLCHLLCSSDDIIGFGEAHNAYRRRTDLAKLLADVRHHTGENPMKYRYVLDKIVGQQHEMGASVLTDQRTRYVFLIRDPLPSLASIVAMRRTYHPDDTEKQLIGFATNYYAERLAQLVDLARTIDDPDRCLIVTHRQLLTETPIVFTELERFLDLREPLREDYEIMPTTGQPGIGDPSPNILSGKIDRTLPRKFISLSAQNQQRMAQCYEECLSSLADIIEKPVTLPLASRKLAA